MNADSMRLCVVLMVSVKTDWVPSDASVTRATRSPKTAKAVWVSVACKMLKVCPQHFSLVLSPDLTNSTGTGFYQSSLSKVGPF